MVSRKTTPHINTDRFLPYDNQNTFISKSFDIMYRFETPQINTIKIGIK